MLSFCGGVHATSCRKYSQNWEHNPRIPLAPRPIVIVIGALPRGIEVCVCVCVAWFLFVWRIATTRTTDNDQRDMAGTPNRNSREYGNRTAARSLAIV